MECCKECSGNCDGCVVRRLNGSENSKNESDGILRKVPTVLREVVEARYQPETPGRDKTLKVDTLCCWAFLASLGFAGLC